jgi:hypothetical protein
LDLLGNKFSTLQQIKKKIDKNTSSTLKPNLISSRFYSTSINKNYSSAVVYPNADLDKTQILKENKNKSGVYLWKNLINNQIYVGSSSSLSSRFSSYFSIQYLLNIKGNSYIRSALLKYGYSNFSLEILEYCKPQENLKKEQYYLDLLKPCYNILQKAGSSLGRRHGYETLVKMRKSKKINNNSIIGTAAVSKSVELTDIFTSTITILPTISAAERFISASMGSLHKALKNNKNGLYKKRYKIRLLPSKESY